MKTVLAIILAAALSSNASAQKIGHPARFYHARPRVILSTGVYSPFYPYYGYGYFGYPYPAYTRPTRLELQIQDIRNDYHDKIWSARHDKSIPRIERRKNIHELKHERDQAIIDAKRNYYKRRY